MICIAGACGGLRASLAVLALMLATTAPARAQDATFCGTTKEEGTVKAAYEAMQPGPSYVSETRIYVNARVQLAAAYTNCATRYEKADHYAQAALAMHSSAIQEWTAAGDEHAIGDDYTEELVGAHGDEVDALVDLQNPSVDQTNAGVKDAYVVIRAMLDKVDFAQKTWSKPPNS